MGFLLTRILPPWVSFPLYQPLKRNAQPILRTLSKTIPLRKRLKFSARLLKTLMLGQHRPMQKFLNVAVPLAGPKNRYYPINNPSSFRALVAESRKPWVKSFCCYFWMLRLRTA